MNGVLTTHPVTCADACILLAAARIIRRHNGFRMHDLADRVMAVHRALVERERAVRDLHVTLTEEWR